MSVEPKGMQQSEVGVYGRSGQVGAPGLNGSELDRLQADVFSQVYGTQIGAPVVFRKPLGRSH